MDESMPSIVSSSDFNPEDQLGVTIKQEYVDIMVVSFSDDLRNVPTIPTSISTSSRSELNQPPEHVDQGEDEEDTCLVCGKPPYYQCYKPQTGRGSKIWHKWRQDCGRSLCSLLSLSTDPFYKIMAYGPYCKFCSTLIWDLHFTLGEFKGLQKKLKKIQKVLEDKLGTYRLKLDKAVRCGRQDQSSADNIGLDKQKFKYKQFNALRKTHKGKLWAVENIVKEMLNGRSNRSFLDFDGGGNNLEFHNGFGFENRSSLFDQTFPGESFDDAGPSSFPDDDYHEFGLSTPIQEEKASHTLPVTETSEVTTNQANTNSESKKRRKASEKCHENLKYFIAEVLRPDHIMEDTPLHQEVEYQGNEDHEDEWIHSDINSDNEACSNVENVKVLKVKATSNPARKRIPKPGGSAPKKRILKKPKTKVAKSEDPLRIAEKVQCLHCTFIGTKRSLQDHTRETHPDARFTCKVCPITFKSQVSLESHVNTVHSKKFDFHCGTCHKGFIKQEDLISHEEIHKSSSTPFLCADCGDIFTNSGDLQRHVLKHVNPFQCEQCFKCYTSAEELEDHQKHHRRTVQCDVCGLGCYSENRLRQHMNSHSSDKRFQCDQCHLSYKYLKGLRMHQRLHTGERPFACKVCGKAFYDSGHLKKHEEIHSGTKAYTCGMCGKGFFAKQNLKQHERIHNPLVAKRKRTGVPKSDLVPKRKNKTKKQLKKVAKAEDQEEKHSFEPDLTIADGHSFEPISF